MVRFTPSSLSTAPWFSVTAMNAAIKMVTDMDTVNETAGSVQVCAEITGVSGMLECAVTNTATLNGNAKTSKLCI